MYQAPLPYSKSTGKQKASWSSQAKRFSLLQHHHALLLFYAARLPLHPATTRTSKQLLPTHISDSKRKLCLLPGAAPCPPFSCSPLMILSSSPSPTHTQLQAPQARPPPQCCCSTRPGNHPCAPQSSRQAPYRGFCVRGFVYGARVPKKDALLQLLLEPEAPVWLPPSPVTTPAGHHRLAVANHGTFLAGVHPAHWDLESSAAPG